VKGRFSPRNSWTESLHFRPLGKGMLAVSDGQSIQLWNTETGQNHILVDSLQATGDIQTSRNGKLLATKFSKIKHEPDLHFPWSESDSYTQLWDVSSGRKLAVLQDSRLEKFSPDGKTLATTDRKGQIMLWDVDSLVRQR
jgi:WD40 repeat protein